VVFTQGGFNDSTDQCGFNSQDGFNSQGGFNSQVGFNKQGGDTTAKAD